MTRIERAAVIGAGVMGAGIAAHVANAGIPVLLLDVIPEGASNRNALAESAIDKLLKADPAPFMHPRAARLVTPGNIEDDLGCLAGCDWIVEAVVEDLGVKRALYGRIEAARRPGSVVSSNTSTLRLADLAAGLPGRFRRDFLITHFFNPPRYMRLLELVAGPETRPEAAEAVRDFADVRLGKSVVDAKDTPGFIANRIGGFWIQCAVGEAIEGGLSVEETDAVLGRPMGIPKTGVFGLIDLVGLDLVPRVARSLAASLPGDDPFQAIYREHDLIQKMIAAGYTGRKGKGGFYRLAQAAGKDGRRVKEVRDLRTGEYRPAAKPRLASVEAAKHGGLRALFESPDPTGSFAWRVMSRTLAYAASLVPEIADSVHAVDEAMRLGYGWEKGPFELIDDLGPTWFAAKLRDDGLPVPPLVERVGGGTFYRVEAGALRFLGTDGGYAEVPRRPGVLLLADVKRRTEQPVARNGSASLWDIGDGVACLEFHTKMNAIDQDTLALIDKAVEIVAKGFKALVIYNEAPNFSVGANLGLALFAANVAAWPMIEDLVAQGQRTFRKLRQAPFPVVGAPSGMALGGGCEVLLHCDAVQAHAETYTGLVETGVGVVPAWGGCTTMLGRWLANPRRPGGPMPAVSKVFETLGMATVAKSAAEAKELLFLRPDDGVTMNRDRVLADAKARALELAEGYTPPEPCEMTLPGPAGRVALELAVKTLRLAGKATPHDEVVAGRLALVLSGGEAADITTPLQEDAVLRLERAAFMDLVKHPATLARMEHMLETGKPLRN